MQPERELYELAPVPVRPHRSDLHGHGAAPYMPTAIDLFEKARRHERLEQLRAAREHDLMPYFRVLEGPTGPVVEMEGRERIMLGSNNYLGLTGDPRVKQAARDALERYGTGLTGSRFLNGTLSLHLELEQELADWMGEEEALVFTTGYLANTGAIGTLLEPGDTVICDSGDHASILDAVSMSRARIRPFRHNRLDKLETMLARAGSDGGGVLVVVDGVFSMEGDLAPIPDIAALCRAHGARLMIDEAHGVGVLGARGAGASEAFGAEDEVDLRMGTFSKSLASCGGFLAGPAEVIDFLRVQSRSFMFTASAVPAAVGAARGALAIIRSDEGPQLMAKVLDNARYLHDGLADLGYHVLEPNQLPDGSEVITPIVPVLVGDDWRAVLLWKALYDAGMYVNVAIYPAVQRGGALLRTSVMASHEREHLDRALAIFEQVKDEAAEAVPPVASEAPAAAPEAGGDEVRSRP
jgi:8-amino-7-oxononanoate synthase